MSIISKIKLNYYNNLYQIYLNDQKYEDFTKLFEKNIQEPSANAELLLKYTGQIIEMPEAEKIFNQNLSWINSYDVDDCHFVNSFINYYAGDNKDIVDHYSKELNNHSVIKKLFSSISFSDFQKYSYFFQLLISRSNEFSNKFINASSAFFETSDGKMFTHPRLSSCYIYIIKNPIEIFKKLLHLNQNNQELALQKILNLDQKPAAIETDIMIEEMQSDWATNVSSWTNQNVIDTFRGLIIKYEDLINDTYDTLVSIVFHLNEAGLNLKLDYKKIEYFLEKNNPLNLSYNNTISSSSKKRLSRSLGHMATKFGYDI